jgi:hypothetical protein
MMKFPELLPIELTSRLGKGWEWGLFKDSPFGGDLEGASFS